MPRKAGNNKKKELKNVQTFSHLHGNVLECNRGSANFISKWLNTRNMYNNEDNKV